MKNSKAIDTLRLMMRVRVLDEFNAISRAIKGLYKQNYICEMIKSIEKKNDKDRWTDKEVIELLKECLIDRSEYEIKD